VVAEWLVGNCFRHDRSFLSSQLEHVTETPIGTATSRRNTLLDTNRNVF
jgi:hypothetical protein